MRQPENAFRLRLMLLLGIVGLAMIGCIAVAIGIAGSTGATMQRLAGIQLEAVEMARDFRAAVDDLHGALLRLGTEPVEDGTATIALRQQQLRDWLGERLQAANSAEEHRVLNELQTELEAYFRRIDALGQRAAGWSAPLEAAALVSFDDMANRLQSLADDFARVHDTGMRNLLTTSLRGLLNLRNLVFGCLGLLIVALTVTAVVLYRDVVRPLRVQLVEGRKLLAQREKLAALGTLAAGIAHEVRNPLTAIKARLYALRRQVSAADASEDLHAVAAEIDRLERIVREVLEYSRPSPPVLEQIDAGDWLGRLAQFVQPDLERAGISLRLDVEPGLALHADPGQLRQILLNLIRNAREALSGQPGHIVLAARRDRASAPSRPGDRVVLTVTDDGPGIPGEVQSRLFDPFFTTKRTGTGLGLSIVARLVEAHGGDTAFQTAAGAGTTIAVRLPIPRDGALPPAGRAPVTAVTDTTSP